MAQVKIFGLTSAIKPIQSQLSERIHSCIVDAMALPADKKFHRFICMDKEDFIYPADRTEQYLIIEISMFEGRSIEAKKTLYRLLFERLGTIGISKNDIEITIFETPKHNWGIRGLPADELQLNYKVDV
ncbi:tautomerase family protein [Paenibacillus sp. N1-5-1-14]|uniref:tautomerase family protein n=1 Tax=Paenibacillus radicibacter TaxID=2972488 RepID=UPI002158A961|nr:tautomerase family protein [Paenibacillus radicibacter]MCR8644449.1 tautomerase family protein [Paenibacillus radicibacter]